MIVLDIGNSRVKIFTRDFILKRNYEDGWIENVREFLQKNWDKSRKIAYSSVNPIAERKLIDSLPYQWINSATFIENQKEVDFQGITGMGLDRKMGLFGAMSITNPPFITVDCGTAITVNVLNTKKQCLGGAILPGLTTQFKALHHFTGKLPLVQYQEISKISGSDTETAIRLGVIHGIEGALHRILMPILASEHIETVIFTGGDGNIFAQLLQKNWDKTVLFDENLVCKGIMYLMEKEELG